MKPILCDPDVKSNLQALHEHFAVVIIENAANNLLLSEKNITSLSS